MLRRVLASAAAAVAMAAAGRAALPADAASPAEVLRQAGDIPFLAGRVAALRESGFSGRPVLLFCTRPGSEPGIRLADRVFRDPEVVALAERFVTGLVDGAADREMALSYDAVLLPQTLFLDPRGRVVGRIEGCVEPWEFLAGMRAALRVVGPFSLRKEARELQASAAALDRALLRGDWKGTLRAVAAIEAVGHEGREAQAARDAKEAAEAEAAKRIADARTLKKNGRLAEARGALLRVASEFVGLDAAVEARNLVKEMDAEAGSDDGGGSGDDGGGGKKDPKKGGGHGHGGNPGRRRGHE